MSKCFLSLLRPMCLCLVILASFSAPLAMAGTAAATSPVCVLFVGNSLTNRNDLPAVFQAYLGAARPQLKVETKMIAPDGLTLFDHRARGDVEKAISSERWDYVVLQEGSDIAPGYSLNGVDFYTPPTRSLEQEAYFNRLARAYGAKPVIFEGWGDEQRFAFIEYASIQVARANHALLAPIGRVWREMQAQGVGLVGTDNVHPNATGTFLLAVTIAETLFADSAKDVQSPSPQDVAPQDARKIRAAAVREVRRLKADGLALPAVPKYAPSVPEPPAGEAIGDNVVGRWCAQDGGIRLSFGTELNVRRDDGQLRVSVKDFSTSALIEPNVIDLRVDGRLAAFKIATGSVQYEVQFAPSKGALQVLTGYDTNKTHRIYRSIAYTHECGQYFDRLHDLYAALAKNERELGLAAALKLHYAQLPNLVDEATFKRYRQGFPISEWDPIIAGMIHSNNLDSDRALDYYKAALDMAPDSVDANFYYGKGLAAIGRRADARAAYSRALVLNAGKSREMTSIIEEELASQRDP